MKKILASLLLVVSSMISAVYADAPAASALKTTRAERVAIVDTYFRSLDGLSEGVIEDAYQFVGNENLSPEKEAKLTEIRDSIARLTEQKEALLSVTYINLDGEEVPAFDENHESVVALNNQIDALEKEVYELLYDGSKKHEKLVLAVGLAGLVAYGMHRWKDGDSVSKVRKYTPHLGTTAALGHVLGGKHDYRNNSNVTTGFIMLFSAAAIEYVLRGSSAVSFKAVKAIATKLAKLGIDVFGDGGYADKLESWVECKFHHIEKWLNNHQGDKAELALGLLAAGGAAYLFFKGDSSKAGGATVAAGTVSQYSTN